MCESRDIDKFCTIFELINPEATGFHGNVSTRVMFLYNRLENRSEFKVLGKGIPKELDSRIQEWLKKNFDINKMLYGIRHPVVDATDLN